MIYLFNFFYFKRHFTLIYLPVPNGAALKSIFTGTLEAALLHNDKSNIDADLSSAIVDASLSLLEIVCNVLKPAPTLGRQHYQFNMKTITTVLQVHFCLFCIWPCFYIWFEFYN